MYATLCNNACVRCGKRVPTLQFSEGITAANLEFVKGQLQDFRVAARVLSAHYATTGDACVCSCELPTTPAGSEEQG